MFYSIYFSKLGKIYMLSDGESLIATFFENQKNAKSLKNCQKNDELPLFNQTKQWYDDYFNKKNPQVFLPLVLDKSAFRQNVYDILKNVPFGKTISYDEIAKKFGRKMSAQAVGMALAKNNYIIIIPCHRVIAKSGELKGYAGGIDKKKWLIEFEGN